MVKTTRAAGITAAAGTRLTQLLFNRLFTPIKSLYKKHKHSESPRHTCVHCEGFAPAAPRRAWVRVSVPIWGLQLTLPLPVLALVSHYLTNKLIGRSPILKRRSFCLWNISVSEGYGELSSISRGYAPLEGRLATCYSAFRLLAEDLHGLVEL